MRARTIILCLSRNFLPRSEFRHFEFDEAEYNITRVGL
jgi:hypothetical protein